MHHTKEHYIRAARHLSTLALAHRDTPESWVLRIHGNTGLNKNTKLLFFTLSSDEYNAYRMNKVASTNGFLPVLAGIPEVREVNVDVAMKTWEIRPHVASKTSARKHAIVHTLFARKMHIKHVVPQEPLHCGHTLYK